MTLVSYVDNLVEMGDFSPVFIDFYKNSSQKLWKSQLTEIRTPKKGPPWSMKENEKVCFVFCHIYGTIAEAVLL